MYAYIYINTHSTEAYIHHVLIHHYRVKYRKDYRYELGLISSTGIRISTDKI